MTTPSHVKTALITGASSGIGRELARVFAAHGHHLVLVARNKERLEALADELERRHDVRVAVLLKDLTASRAPDEIFEKIKETGLQIDILVNNAGFASSGPFYAIDAQKDLDMIQLNVTALVLLTRLFLPDMVTRKSGRVLNVASTAAFQPGPYMATYYATKAYVLSFSNAIAKELEGTGVTVTTLCPGPVRTDFQDRAGIRSAAVAGDWIIMNAPPVARAGYDGLMKGKRVVVPGLFHKFHMFAVRFLPRAFLLKVVASLNRDRRTPREPVQEP